jgi:hypothetical protein
VKGVREGRYNFFWCFGASLARLLPAIEINKEFTAFFDDPKRERLTGWQSFVFSAIRRVGWVFGLILLAAISGLTQGSYESPIRHGRPAGSKAAPDAFRRTRI